MDETIFFATFRRGQNRSDRRQYFSTKKTLIQFHKWIEEQRNDVEEKKKKNYAIESINFIELTRQ